METLAKLKDSVFDALHISSPPSELHPVSRSQVLSQEEDERLRRLEQVSQSRVDRENAANLSKLIKTQKFPVFRGNVSRGYKRVTERFEEEERRRRLTNKSESALRRANANKTARMIQILGWPLVRNSEGPEYIIMDSTMFLEEEERQWRTSNAYWSTIAKHNAATVANILRWNNFQPNPWSGSRRYARMLEAKERAYRLQPDVFERCMVNAGREAALIRHLGYPFYVQEADRKTELLELHKLEEQERKYRIKNPLEEQLAHEVAGIVSSAFNNDKQLEEKERRRREEDVRGQMLARVNAKHVSLLIRESSANMIGPGPVWFSISRNSMRALEEIERSRRLRDFDGQRHARQLAREVSALVLEGLANSNKPGFISLEEEERQSRILDRTQQHISMKNARKVSGLIARHFLFNTSSKSYALAMEESERSLRLHDESQQRIARANASKVSSLVQSLHDAPTHHVQEITIVETNIARSAAPIAQIPTAQASQPIRKEVPSLPLEGIKVVPTPAPAVAPIPSAPPTLTTTTTRTTSTYIAPIAAPVFAAPIAPVEPSGPLSLMGTTAPLPPAPQNVTPLTAASQTIPLAPPALATLPTAPIVAAPLPPSRVPPAAPVATAPIAPILGASIVAAPLATAPIQRQASNTSLGTTYSTVLPGSTVPVDRYMTGAAPALGERQRRKLEKESSRHQRKADKDLRKAEQSLLKAEKMHQKGRDDKALKLENKASHLTQLADHERKWASGLQNEVAHNAPAPAPASM